MKSIIFSVDGREDIVKGILNAMRDLPAQDVPLIGKLHPQKFSDGEVCVDFESSVRGKRVYLISSPNDSDKIMQLNFAIDAAKRAAAKEIIPIIPYFPYARQDKKDQTRGPIGGKVFAEMLENRGATQIITFDLHADQIQGFFNIPVTHMEGKYLFDRYLYDTWRENEFDKSNECSIVLCAPDAGAAKRVKHFRDQNKERWGIDFPIVMIDKTRKEANKVDSMVIIGDVENKHVIIIDDMCDTGGTLIKAATELKDAGACSVRAIVTHGVLSGPALERIWDAKYEKVLDEFVCSDSLPIEGREFVLEQGVYPKAEDFITIVSTGKQISKAIMAIDGDTSVEDLKHKD